MQFVNRFLPRPCDNFATPAFPAPGIEVLPLARPPSNWVTPRQKASPRKQAGNKWGRFLNVAGGRNARLPQHPPSDRHMRPIGPMCPLLLWRGGGAESGRVENRSPAADAGRDRVQGESDRLKVGSNNLAGWLGRRPSFNSTHSTGAQCFSSLSRRKQRGLE